MGTQIKTIKAVMNGGEMSPLMDGRTDTEKYATGCRLLENFVVRPMGGVFKRPGLRQGIIGSTINKSVRLIPFKRSATSNYVLLFIDATDYSFIRIYSCAAGVLTFVTELTADYLAADIRKIQVCQLNDIMFLAHPSYKPQMITRASDGTWTIEDVPFKFAPALDPPTDGVTLTIVPEMPNWVSGTTYAVSAFVLYQNEMYRCKTANSDVTFTGSKWDKAVYRTPWNVAQSYVAGDVVEYFGSNYFCTTAHTSSSANRPTVGTQWQIVNITDYRLIASSATFDANEVGSIWLLSPGSTNRITSETIPASTGTTTSAAIFIQGAYLARTNWSSGGAPQQTILQLQESLDRMNFTTIREWYMNGANEGTISYTAEAPSTGGWYRWVAIKSSASGTGTMTVEPAIGVLNIPFDIQAYTSTTIVKGVPKLAADSLIPNEVLGTAFPVWRKGAFSVTRGYPRTVAFHDQRLWFGGTATEPMRLWSSETDNFYTFLTGTLDTSGIDVTLAATQANDIEWITSFKRTLVIGTTGEEWTLDSGDQDNALTPSSVRLRRWTRYGSCGIPPILAGDALLWLTKDKKLREFSYVFEKDGYSAPDMSILAEHIPIHRGRVVEMCYTQSPDPIVWFTFEGGEFAGFSYDRENNVTAWHRHNFGNKDRDCESVCAIYSTDSDGDAVSGDTLVFLIENSNAFSLEVIDGQQWMASMTSMDPTFLGTSGNLGPGTFCDSWILSMGTFNSGTQTTSYPVGAHLNGCSVVFTNFITGAVRLNADGSPQEVPVSGGVAVLPGNPAALYIVGVAYSAFCMPNRIEIPLQDGTSQIRRWRLVRAAFRLFQSKFGNFYTRPEITDDYLTIPWDDSTAIRYDDMDEFQLNSFALWAFNTSSIKTKTGQTKPQSLGIGWGDAADITISSRHPYPFNLQALILDVEIGDESGAP